jgi:uncharacterized membrane protein
MDGRGESVRRRPVAAVLLWVAIGCSVAFFYDGIVRALLLGFVRLPLIPGGLASLTAIVFAGSVAHAWQGLGARNLAIFLAVSAAISWLLEETGVATGLIYGAYHYTDYLGPKLGNVPVLIPIAWFMMIYPSYVIAGLALERRAIGTPRGLGRLVALALAGAAVMTAWDFVVDPILSGESVRAWIWENGGEYYGVPLHNYAGWFVTTFAVHLAYRAFEQRHPPVPLAAPTRGIVALPVLTYGLMLVSDLVTATPPAGVWLVGIVAMGIPLAAGCVGLAHWQGEPAFAGAGPAAARVPASPAKGGA